MSLGCAPQDKPVLHALGIQLDCRRLLERIVGPHDLDRPAITGFPLVEDHNAVKRLFLLAKSSQADCQHVYFLLPRIIAGSAYLRYPAERQGPLTPTLEMHGGA